MLRQPFFHVMNAELLPLGPASAVGRVEPDLPPPPSYVEPLPRPRSPEDEPKPFHARLGFALRCAAA